MAQIDQPTRMLYDRRSAAETLSTSERRIDELRRAGKLPSVRDGRQYKYRHDDLQRYVDSLATFETGTGR
ncbi:helix-turn-helix domain-containing protein [Mycobacterium sp. SMC-8]|uniref:helix-turn-helix domain-containing protein n=1 Tax=Mycobacterium sp. SMC-8 TaxID=2857060 RepID=UPI0021B3A8C3|nr:helix-turn-helix domain-containing protein [Mycobacterium sp. SMC-8]UXA12394.1 helix-turn-helix domain-containing protein [Mycobacterium sp. SMC-8]